MAAGPDLAPEVWDNARNLALDAGIEALLALRPTGGSAAEAELLPIDGVRVGHLSALAAEQPHDRFVGEPPSATDLAALFHTGGTTGTPKLAAHTHANEVTDAWMLAAIGVLDSESVAFAALPLFHVNALVVTLLAPLFKGQRVVWAGPLGYRDTTLFANFWKVVERYRISFMSGVPTIYAVLADRPVDADISSLRFALVGASPLPKAVRERFESATGVPLMEGYGLTEATCASARSFVDRPVPGSVGQRLPYQQVKTIEVNADGEWVDLPTGEVGVLAIGGPTVFPGYVVDRGPDGPVLDGLGKLREGWLDTGDLARVDDDGFVHLVGRAKDLIIRGGHNIDPAVIENALLAHPAVTAAQAVGRPRHARRRGAGRVRHPRPRRRRDPRGAACLGVRPRARAGRGAQGRHRAGHAPCHPRGQAVQTRPARRGHPRGRRRSAPQHAHGHRRPRGCRGRHGRRRRRPGPRRRRDLGHGSTQPLRTHLEIGTVMNPTPILAGLLVIAFAAAGSAKLAAVPAMRARAEHVGFSVSAYRRIGLLEVLGVLGLLVGAFVPLIGALAAAGLLMLLGGALVAHLRNRDGVREIAPALVLGLVTLTFLLLVLGDLR